MEAVEEKMHVYDGLYTHLHWGNGCDAGGNSWFE